MILHQLLSDRDCKIYIKKRKNKYAIHIEHAILWHKQQNKTSNQIINTHTHNTSV